MLSENLMKKYSFAETYIDLRKRVHSKLQKY